MRGCPAARILLPLDGPCVIVVCCGPGSRLALTTRCWPCEWWRQHRAPNTCCCSPPFTLLLVHSHVSMSHNISHRPFWTVVPLKQHGGLYLVMSYLCPIEYFWYLNVHARGMSINFGTKCIFFSFCHTGPITRAYEGWNSNVDQIFLMFPLMPTSLMQIWFVIPCHKLCLDGQLDVQTEGRTS